MFQSVVVYKLGGWVLTCWNNEKGNMIGGVERASPSDFACTQAMPPVYPPAITIHFFVVAVVVEFPDNCVC